MAAGQKKKTLGTQRRSSPPTGPMLVGRERELGQLEAELARARTGGARCVLLSGEAGVGKTRLARELLARHPRQMVSLSARAYPLGSTAAFGLWAEALERHLQELSPGEVAGLCGGYLDDLAILLHSVAAARGWAPDREPPRLRLLEGLARVVGNLADQQPVVVLLDDVHLADASSWEALQHLVRNLDDRAFLVLLTARPVELSDHPIGSEVVLGLEQEGFLTRLSMTPLGDRDVAALVAEIVGESAPEALVEWVGARARGNPLFIGGLVRALLEEGADLRAPELQRLPEELTDRVTTRVRLLDEPSRQTLELLALLGRPVEWGALVELSGRDTEELVAVVQALAHSRLVREEERGRDLFYEVTHPLIQEAVYEAIGAARRRQLHRLVGRSLLAAGRLGEAAPHFARSAGVGDVEAIGALRDALAQTEAREAHREGLAILSSLVELLPPGDERWMEVASSLSQQTAWVHRGGSPADLGVKAMRAIDAALAGSGLPGRQAEVKFRLAGFLAWGIGELEEAERCCSEAVDLFRQAGEERKALLAATELSAIYGLRGDLAAWGTSAEAALEAATARGERGVLVQALGNFGLACWHQGDFDGCDGVFVRCLELVREDPKPHRLCLSLLNVAAVGAVEGRFEGVDRLLEEAKAVNPGYRDSQVPEYEIFIGFFAGDFRGCLEAAHTAYVTNPSPPGLRRAFALAWAALAATEHDALGQAEHFLARSRAVYGEQEYFVFTDCRAWAEGLLACRQGRGEGRAMLRGAADRFVDKGALGFASQALLDLTEWEVAHDDSQAAAAAAGRMQSFAPRIRRPLYSGLAATARAQSELLAGDAGGAATSAGEAVDLISSTGCRAYLGRAWETLGRTLSGTDRAGAGDAFERAAVIFEECGATWRRDRCLEALRGLRGRAGRAAAAVTGPTSLSKREREVARLAGKGMTAGEVAAELFISERTVEGHLANVYAKLGVGSKLELVRRAGEFDL
jgi:DNA-binding CsgD family transcriptional regulator/tetratricopeptide (TPR) repeat protein